MKVEFHNTPGSKPYYTVLVEKGELEIGNGRTLDFSTWIGTIDLNGKITQWTPAGYCPRGYKAAAARALTQARDELRKGGNVQ